MPLPHPVPARPADLRRRGAAAGRAAARAPGRLPLPADHPRERAPPAAGPRQPGGAGPRGRRRVTAERNKAVVRRWIEEFESGGDESVSDALRSPQFVNHSAPPGGPTGPEAGKLAFRAMRAAFPDLHVRIDDMLAEGDRVVTRQTFSGTHHGEWSGVPATGRRVSW